MPREKYDAISIMFLLHMLPAFLIAAFCLVIIGFPVFSLVYAVVTSV